ncbi:Myeloid differentiation primary response 88 [Paramuricea clavata]|nr:Myeloid differentiation primary response 88 [Paramuricea clavata]
METKLREFLRVITYDVKVRDTTTKNKPSVGVLHITRNKLVLIAGLPPNHSTLLDYTFAPSKNGITLALNEGLSFTELPNIVVLSDQTDDIWRTIQACMRAVGFCEPEEGQVRIAPSTSVEDKESLWLTSMKCSMKTQYVYYNLPTRPCKYIYMNLPDRRKAPHLNHEYINVFHVGSVYQNCWRSCIKPKDEDDTEIPPPPPPRQKPPPLPPKPRNRPPNSPLPPLPVPLRTPPSIPLPKRPDDPPSLPLPRLPEKYVRKEIQYVVYSSKPVMGQIFVIQVVFFQKNDYATLERIKKLEEEANYQVLKPLPDSISVSGDLRISLLDIDESCTLKSERNQVIEHEIVKEAILQSCWLIIEFHLEHNDKTRRNFHSKIVMQPKSGLKPRSSRTSKDVQISTTFQDVVQNGLHSPTPVVCNSLKSIGVRKYLEVCGLMDIPCALHNDWTGLAGEIGLTVDEVFKIQSKACFPNFSPTNEVLNIWSQRQSKSCNIDEFKVKLGNLQRGDVLEVLDESDS